MNTAQDELQTPDELPENCHYHDEGCELAPFCLECPFPYCVHDRVGGKRRSIKEMRDEEVYHLFVSGKWRIKELAQHFHVSPRTIQRALAQQKEGNHYEH